MTKTVLFDLGNVLVSFSHERMYEQIGRVCGRSGAAVADHLAFSGLMADYEEGRVTTDEFHHALESWIGHCLDREAMAQAAADIFWLNEPMIDVLSRLKANGIRLVLLSNTVAVHIEFVRRRWKFLDDFDDLTLSFEVGAMKPKAAIFEAALSKIGCEPHECFYTDDIAEYVAAGRAYGLDAEIFTSAEACRAHLAQRGLL